MAKKIYPGNWVETLSSYQGQPVVAAPGRIYYHLIGYALVGATGATEFDVVLPSPDRRADDKPRTDIVGMKVPLGAKVYHVGLRVPDMRRDRALGTATSGVTGTATNTIKLASASGATTDAISATAISTKAADLTVAASGALAPASTVTGVITPVALTSALTLKVYSSAAAISSSATGGTPLIAEVCFFIDDVVPELDDVRVPFPIRSGQDVGALPW